VTGGTFGLQLVNLRRDDPFGFRALGISPGAMAMLVISRILVIPLINLGFLFLIYDRLPNDPMSRLILFFQPAGVTANIVTVLATLMDRPEAAQMVASSALPQMILYVPVATALIAWGMMCNEQLS